MNNLSTLVFGKWQYKAIPNTWTNIALFIADDTKIEDRIWKNIQTVTVSGNFSPFKPFTTTTS